MGLRRQHGFQLLHIVGIVALVPVGLRQTVPEEESERVVAGRTVKARREDLPSLCPLKAHCELNHLVRAQAQPQRLSGIVAGSVAVPQEVAVDSPRKPAAVRLGSRRSACENFSMGLPACDLHGG